LSNSPALEEATKGQYRIGAMPAPLYLHHPSSLDHDTGDHPEQAARIPAIEDALAARSWLGFERELAPAVELEQLYAVHPKPYVDEIERLSAAGGGMLDVDTVAGSGSYEAALHSAGGAVRSVDALMAGETALSFCGLRPPGHHAEPVRAMGFCIFNNIAIAAQRALEAHGAERVLVLDWDVHHGNGTNDIFYATSGVLYASIHQSPLYPGTGALTESGVGEGEGYTINLPVPPGSGHAEWLSLIQNVVVPVARSYEPRLLLISAGFDAHRDDPLAGCSLTEESFAAMAAAVRELARELGAPLGFVLEGGYSLRALAASVVAVLEAASDGASAAQIAPDALTERARSHYGRWWAAVRD
jgi:acetoin utilization deacetylase AcuC-like enzyme